MNGPPLEPIDHDRFFKELLTTFFVEFLELFFPKLSVTLDPHSVEFLTQELYVNQMAGEEYRADIVAKVRSLQESQEAFFLIHIEHQSTAPANFSRRFFRYYSAIFEKHDLPVYPIVVYSHDLPRRKQPRSFFIDFPDGRVLSFTYRVVQLNRLSWRKFVNSHNPIASALMSKMKIAPRDRPRVKLECLRLLVTLKLDRARMRLIASFVDAYLRLNQNDERRFHKVLQGTALKPRQREEIVEYVTSWEQRGIEKGLERGREQGREQGALQALRAVLLDVLTTRFGSIEKSLVARIDALASVDDLRRLTHQAITAASPSDIALPPSPATRKRRRPAR